MTSDPIKPFEPVTRMDFCIALFSIPMTKRR